METILNCPICEGKTFTPNLSCIDYTVSRETFSIVECDNCHFLFTNPRPNSEGIGKYYQSDDYVSHSGTKKGLINSLYHFARRFTLAHKFNVIRKYAPKDVNLLDIGCGTGEFLNYCKQKGWNTHGIEPGDVARAAAVRNYGLSVFSEEHLEQQKPNSFDVITMWHVLEHVHELQKRVKQIKTLLKPIGYAFIAVPNHQSYDAQCYNRFWAGYDVPRHLYHFDKQSITTLFEQEQLELISMLPMKLDAFYVSMLSEKYKYGKINYLRAVLNGLKSNIKAGGKSELYSSVIYIFKKN